MSHKNDRAISVAATLDNCNRLASLMVALGSDSASQDNVMKARNLLAAALDEVAAVAGPHEWVKHEGIPELPGVYAVRQDAHEDSARYEVVVFTDGIARPVGGDSESTIAFSMPHWWKKR